VGRRLIKVLAVFAAVALTAASLADARHTSHRRTRRAHKTAKTHRTGKMTDRYQSYEDTAAPAATNPPLMPGNFRFWDGTTVQSGDVQTSSECGVTGPCYTWPLKVGPGGRELRVAIDTPARTNQFELDVVSPSGTTTSTVTSNEFDAEAYVHKPEAGTYTIRVMPQDVSYASFRMRAKLEGPLATPPAHKVMLLPELEADPPTEFTFIAPANPANGLYPPDTVNPPLDVLGVHPLSCTADEMAPTTVQGGAATRCLRFTSGPMNVGAGDYEMHWTYAQDIVDGKIQNPIAHGPMFQTVHWSDGSTTTRSAGTYSFHVIHFHFHDDGILSMKLYRVLGPGKMVQAGVGTKSGFCPANELLGDWRSFANAPNGAIGSGDVGTGNCQNPADGVLGLSAGWGDVYRWQRPGMYVEFGHNPDGLYVVTITIDIEHHVLQSSYAHNTSYALVRVTGDTVDELERGIGTSPWDPHKVVFTGEGPASRN
jgi:hypothetical protein